VSGWTCRVVLPRVARGLNKAVPVHVPSGRCEVIHVSAQPVRYDRWWGAKHELARPALGSSSKQRRSRRSIGSRVATTH
jgi:hypothetical protein